MTTLIKPTIGSIKIGSNEFEQGQTAALNINLMNKVKFLGFEADERPSGPNEIFAAHTEIKVEDRILDALGIVASLSSDAGNPIEVKSVSQQAGSIRSGQNAVSPLKFDIKIDKKARAGTYPLMLITYDYKKNVQIIDANATLETYDANYWYGIIAQNQTIDITVKKQADFEITRKDGNLLPGSEDIIEITYETHEGDIKYSSNLPAPVEVKETGFFQRYFGWA